MNKYKERKRDLLHVAVTFHNAIVETGLSHFMKSALCSFLRLNNAQLQHAAVESLDERAAMLVRETAC